jgi:hypothetical protein
MVPHHFMPRDDRIGAQRTNQVMKPRIVVAGFEGPPKRAQIGQCFSVSCWRFISIH